jgi:hypothetical protein
MIAHSDPSLDQPLHALIDTGALITGLSNLQVRLCVSVFVTQCRVMYSSLI